MPQLRTVSASPTTRSEERRRKLLVAAADLFLASGYDGVSMDAIVAEAGGSKATAMTPQQFAAFIKEDTERWAPVIRASGAKVE